MRIGFATSTEWVGNLEGGNGTGDVLEGVLDLSAEVNLGAMAGMGGSALFFSGQLLWGDDPSEFFVGDVNAVSNIAAYDTVRLIHAWWEHEWFDGKVTFRVGRFGIDDDFMGSDTAGMFFNSAFGPMPILSLNTPSPIWPLAAPAILGYWESPDGWWLRSGVFDGDAGEEEANDHGLEWRLGDGQGLVWTAETGREFKIGELTLEWKVGGFYNSGHFESLDGSSVGSGSWGVYTILDRQLMPALEDGAERLRGFLRIGYSPENAGNVVDVSVDAGVTGAAGFFNRPEDTWGAAVVWTGFNDNTRQVLGYPNAEKILEATYRVQINEWLALQPDLQIVIDPAEGAGDAGVLILRVETSF